MVEIGLLGDGSSDQVLKHPADWLFRQHALAPRILWADLSFVQSAPKTLRERLQVAAQLYPSAQAFLIHRDAEAQSWRQRRQEIEEAVLGLAEPLAAAVVPVRMTEAWFLFDEVAIRRAASNPQGKRSLNLPRPTEVEALPDPKQRLHQALREASELKGRRLQAFRHARPVIVSPP